MAPSAKGAAWLAIAAALAALCAVHGAQLPDSTSAAALVQVAAEAELSQTPQQTAAAARPAAQTSQAPQQSKPPVQQAKPPVQQAKPPTPQNQTARTVAPQRSINASRPATPRPANNTRTAVVQSGARSNQTVQRTPQLPVSVAVPTGAPVVSAH
jgi:hypothetical protein